MENIKEAGSQDFITTNSVIDNSWNFYKKHFKKLWVLFLFGGIGEAGLKMNSGTNSSGTFSKAVANIPVWEIALIIAGIVALLLFFFVSKLALYKAISDTYKEEFAGVGNSYKKSFKLIFSYIFISIMTTTALWGGFVAFIIPGILLSMYLAFSQFELLHRNKRGLDAAFSSWEIVKGRWWKTIWAVSLPLLYFMLIIFISFLLLGVVGFAMGALAGANIFTTSIIVVAVVIVLLVNFLFLQPISIITFFEVYKHLLSTYVPLENIEATRKSRKNKLVLFWILAVLSLIPLILLAKFGISVAQKNSALTSNSMIPHVEPKLEGSHYTDSNLGIQIDLPDGWKVVKSDYVDKDGSINTVFTSKGQSLVVITKLDANKIRKLAPGISDDKASEILTKSAIYDLGQRLTASGLKGFGAFAIKTYPVQNYTAYALRASAAAPNDPMNITDVEVWTILTKENAYQIMSHWPENEYGWAAKPIHESLNSLKIN